MMRMRTEATYPIRIPLPLLHRSIHWLARGVDAPGVEVEFHVSWLGLPRGMDGWMVRLEGTGGAGGGIVG